MKWTLESRAILNGCLVLALLLLIGSVQYRTIQGLVSSLQWVTHTVAVGNQLGGVQEALTRSSVAARRFVTAGDTGDPDSYRSAVYKLQLELKTLGGMVADNPSQQMRVNQLTALVERRVETLDEAVGKRQKGGLSAEGIAQLDDAALAQMGPISQVVDDMRDEENRLLLERNAQAAANRRRTTAVVALGSLFAVAVVAWGAVALHHDVAERNRVQTQLTLREEALRDLSGRLMQSQDAERRRVARELHDGTSQIVTAVELHLATLQLTVPPDNKRGQASLTELSMLVQRLSVEIRTLSHLLHPPQMEHTGIGSAIRWYVEGFSERSGIPVDVQAPESWPRFSLETETALFRITQEALTNIHRHSGSKAASIRAGLVDGKVWLEISDQGRGIPPEILTCRRASEWGCAV